MRRRDPASGKTLVIRLCAQGVNQIYVVTLHRLTLLNGNLLWGVAA